MIDWRSILVGALAACALSLSGCSGDDDETEGDDDTILRGGDDDDASSAGDDDASSTGDDDASSAGDDDASSTGDDDDHATPTPAPDTPTPGPASYLVLTGDNGSNRFKVIDPVRDRLLYELDLTYFRSDLCAGDEDCFIFGVHHDLIDGHDFLTLSYGLATTRGLNTGFKGNIDRVQLTTPPTLRWRLHALNFSSLPGGASAYCPVSPTDPCQPDPSVPITEAGLCWVGDAHDVEVLWDDPTAQQAEMLVIDTDNIRMFKVRLDYAGGNTCGEVTSFVDGDRHEDWYPGAEPNNLVRVPSDDGRELYLITLRAVTHTAGTDGDGMIQLWELEPDGRWVWHWSFPDQPESGELRALSLPHGGEFIPGGHPEGDLFRFADSAAFADDRSYSPVKPEGGTIATLLLRDLFEPPDYLHDLYLPEGRGMWTFPRFADRLPDGTLLVTDSGCQADVNCDYKARLYWIRDEESINSTRAGYWTANQSQLELRDQSGRIEKTLQCGLISPFWAIAIDADRFGAELTAALEQGGRACP